MPCSDKREIKNEIRGDFAAVDVREELCYHSLPKKQLEEGESGDFKRTQKTAEDFAVEKMKKVISYRQKGRNPQ